MSYPSNYYRYLRKNGPLSLCVKVEDSLTKKAHTSQQPPVKAITSFVLNTNLVNLGHSGRAGVPEKPKVRDPNKWEMTYAEKQKLSSNLQTLTAEKWIS